MRVLVVWCPDWSVVAALREAERPATEPAAVLAANVVEVCNGPAREEGVRRGMRRRDAQARCPELVLLDANPDRDARCFEPVLETVEALRPGVAALRPGLLAVRAPGRFFGGEANAAAVMAETLVDAGVWDCRLGVADDLFTAEQAARRARVQECELVPEGGSAAYLRDLLVEVLEADGAEGREMVSLLRRLGLRTLGDLAALPADAVQHRFGRYGARVWRRARGEAPTLVAPRTPPPDLTAEVCFEPPLDSVEAICFSVRTTTERLVADLASRQLVATGVRVEAEHDGAVASARTWLHPQFFSARDLVDRVHWQLQAGGSLRSRQDAGAVRAPVERVRFLPEVVEPAAAHTEGLWGGSGEELVRARRGQGAGDGGVRRRDPAGAPGRTHPGRPAGRGAVGRAPGRAAAARPALARAAAGAGAVAGVRRAAGRGGLRPVRPGRGGDRARGGERRADPLPAPAVDGGGWQPVAAWAGPWPVDESWWSGGEGRASRFQVVGADGRAWLLVCGATGWRVEAGYD